MKFLSLILIISGIYLIFSGIYGICTKSIKRVVIALIGIAGTGYLLYLQQMLYHELLINAIKISFKIQLIPIGLLCALIGVSGMCAFIKNQSRKSLISGLIGCALTFIILLILL